MASPAFDRTGDCAGGGIVRRCADGERSDPVCRSRAVVRQAIHVLCLFEHFCAGSLPVVAYAWRMTQARSPVNLVSHPVACTLQRIGWQVSALVLLCAGLNVQAAPILSPATTAAQAGLVNVQGLAPEIAVDMRYAGSNNFTGHVVPGYERPRAICCVRRRRRWRGWRGRSRPRDIDCRCSTATGRRGRYRPSWPGLRICRISRPRRSTTPCGQACAVG